jgi:hypothetical protein
VCQHAWRLFEDKLCDVVLVVHVVCLKFRKVIKNKCFIVYIISNYWSLSHCTYFRQSVMASSCAEVHISNKSILNFFDNKFYR